MDESLVERAPGGPGGAGEARFRLLETVREYAAERLAERGEAAAVRRRHAAYFLTLAERAEPEMFGPAQPAWLDRLERELPEFRAALAWAVEQGDGALGLRLVGALAWACSLRPWTSEGVAWLTAVLPEGRRPPGVPPSAALAKVLRLAGHQARQRGDFAAARARFGEQLAVAEEAGDPSGAAWALNELGVLAFTAGDLDRARRLLGEALGRRRALGHAWGVATSLSDLGHVAVLRGDHDAARARYEESLALRRGIGEPRNLAYATRNLGYVAALRGDHPRARALLQESAALFRAGGFDGELAWTLVLLGDAATALGDAGAARAALAEALAIAHDRTGRRPGERPGGWPWRCWASPGWRRPRRSQSGPCASPARRRCWTARPGRRTPTGSWPTGGAGWCATSRPCARPSGRTRRAPPRQPAAPWRSTRPWRRPWPRRLPLPAGRPGPRGRAG